MREINEGGNHGFNFVTKADTLKFLQKKVKKSKIEKIFEFTVSVWENDKKCLLEKISKEFSDKIIVRSSAQGEDSDEKSER